MQKSKYFTCVYDSVLLFNSKGCQIKFDTLFDYENKQQERIIALNHSADIDCKDFVKIYREYTRNSYSFLTIDTTLTASHPLRFRKNLLSTYKNDSNWWD